MTIRTWVIEAPDFKFEVIIKLGLPLRPLEAVYRLNKDKKPLISNNWQNFLSHITAMNAHESIGPLRFANLFISHFEKKLF